MSDPNDIPVADPTYAEFKPKEETQSEENTEQVETESADGELPEQEDEIESEEETSEEEKPKKSHKEHQIDRLKRERAEALKESRELKQRLMDLENADLRARLEKVEKGLPSEKNSDTPKNEDKAPDPTDASKYPLGHLDDRYVEDKIEYLARKQAAAQADAVLQRQQELEQQAEAETQQKAVLEKVETLATKGSSVSEDYREAVVETGMRGDWELTQTTFEAAYEAENGAQILYDLAMDPKEASRVAKLSLYGQIKYVAEKDAELSTSGKARKIPAAGAPAKTGARGANSKVQFDPFSEDLTEYAKARAADAKAGRR